MLKSVTSLRQINVLILVLALFLLLLPASLSIDYYQNDDWVYYKSVENFISGNFELHPYSGPSLYAQAFIGMLFAQAFGIERLPVLTLVVALLSLYVFFIILTKYFKTSQKDALILSMVFFLNPLGIYSIWGFMTEHYYIGFYLLTLYFLLGYLELGSKKHLTVYLFMSAFGLLFRQVSIVLPLAVGLYGLIYKKYKFGAINLMLGGLMYTAYNTVFPRTPRMIEIPLQFHHILDFDYSYALVYGVLVVVSAYLFPAIINVIPVKKLLTGAMSTAVLLLLTLTFFYILQIPFKPMSISWGEFPYFENVVERTGFFPRGVHGTKYIFRGNYDLWKFWDLTGKFVLSLLLAVVVVFASKNFSSLKKYWITEKAQKSALFLLIMLVYIGLMIVTETFYDRYVYFLIPTGLLFFVSLVPKLNFYTRLVSTVYILLLLVLAYNFSADYLLVNKYIWHRGQEIARADGLDPKLIQGTNAWKMTYRNLDKGYIYNFSYDSALVNPDYKEYYTLVEKYKVEYPFNIFVDPVIYLYKLKE